MLQLSADDPSAAVIGYTITPAYQRQGLAREGVGALLDYAVPFLLAKRFDSVLTAPHEGHLYRRLRHSDVADDRKVLARVRAWYTVHGMFERGSS